MKIVCNCRAEHFCFFLIPYSIYIIQFVILWKKVMNIFPLLMAFYRIVWQIVSYLMVILRSLVGVNKITTDVKNDAVLFTNNHYENYKNYDCHVTWLQKIISIFRRNYTSVIVFIIEKLIKLNPVTFTPIAYFEKTTRLIQIPRFRPFD